MEALSDTQISILFNKGGGGFSTVHFEPKNFRRLRRRFDKLLDDFEGF